MLLRLARSSKLLISLIKMPATARLCVPNHHAQTAARIWSYGSGLHVLQLSASCTISGHGTNPVRISPRRRATVKACYWSLTVMPSSGVALSETRSSRIWHELHQRLQVHPPYDQPALRHGRCHGPQDLSS